MVTRRSSGLRQFGASPLLVRFFAASIIVVVALSVARFLLGADSDLLKLGEESNLPTWLSSIQLFTIAAVLSPLALRDAGRHRLHRLWAVPGLFALLSLDEAARLHERLGQWLEAETAIGAGSKSGPWMILFVPIVGVVAIAAAVSLWPYVRERRQALMLFLLGVGLLGASAVGLEIAANFAESDSGLHRAFAFAEETGEMVGANLILWGALLTVRAEGIRVVLGDDAS